MTDQPVQLATRIAPRLDAQLKDAIAQYRQRGERMTVRQAVEEALELWLDAQCGNSPAQ